MFEALTKPFAALAYTLIKAIVKHEGRRAVEDGMTELAAELEAEAQPTIAKYLIVTPTAPVLPAIANGRTRKLMKR